MLAEKYLKLENESELAYICRICDNKPIIGTWQDVADIINKQLKRDWTESAYRKQYQAFKKLLEEHEEVIFKNDNYLQSIKREIEKLELEKVKLNTANIEYRKNKRHDARFEMFYESVAANIKALDVPDFEPLAENVSGDDSRKLEYVLTVADIHAGANFETDNNSYSLSVCSQRFNKLATETIKYINTNNIKNIKVVVLGDDIQGILRVSDLKLNETSVPEATVIVSKLISNLLNKLSKHARVDYYHVPTSNHSQIRPLNTKASMLASEDIEYVIGHYIKDVLANNQRVNVNLNFGYEYIEIPIHNFKTIAIHGHQIRNVNQAVNDLSCKNKVFYDYLFMAHLHAGKECVVGEGGMNDIEVLLCPSFVGEDPYSESFFKGVLPSCKIFTFDSVYGHINTYKIML